MHWITRAGWPGHLIALGAGALTPLALAPFAIWPLALLSIALFYLGLRELTPRQAALRGWCYGVALYLAGSGWIYVSIHDYGAASPLLAGGLTLAFCAAVALFFALPAWLWARYLRRPRPGVAEALAFAALWLAQEAFRGWFLTGFPWLYAGYSQLDGPLRGLAPLGGVWLLSFVLALTAALLCNLLQLRRQHLALASGLSLLLGPWLLAQALNEHAWTHAKGEPLRVAAIQGNVEQNLKWDPDALEAQLALYRDMTLASPPAELIVWPETAVPVLKEYAEGYLAVMARIASDRQAALITGVPLRQVNAAGERRFYNAITVLGEGQGTYLKQKLVPFGEYVPLQDLLRGLIAFFDLPMSDFARGPAQQPLLQAKGLRLASYICYEAVYPEFAAELARDSDLLLTISNDTWFGRSIGPVQHLQMAQMRALEAGRWMIRATNNGISVLIDPQGRIQSRIPPFEAAILYGEVQAMQGHTPYLRFGSLPLAIVAALIVLATLLANRLGKTL
ncbi:apolipoprotein N-acyltransferase [Pseudomonas fluvialis]|uniref:Apolipoprotein N-acyltransferase n=1 Tax=Pseudomonas fluvialis TaxID=1793966 RepID=A0ABQ2AN62_9PSED|nr:apolipoprotein N-acyltransferase [Pseudomonas fluvialis]OXM41377.1 apolipoprotein N-acyltransferase [Pseudomonas fluvialis]GGH92714.1 apolipoprotein N-acyltransferase [Pseudomonas fluvialis]